MFELEVDALHELGHEVATYHVSNSEVLGDNKLSTKVRTALGAAYSKSSATRVSKFLEQERPDISHVHNWFPLLSPSIYSVHQRLNIPVVQTLHNYRLGCAAATYRRDGHECTLCKPGHTYPALKHRCYNNSLAGTLTWKHLIDRNWQNGQFTDRVDHYICPSQEVMQRHIEMGLSLERMSVIPNACPDPITETQPKRRSQRIHVSFVGRLVQEKGAHILLNAWKRLSEPTRANAQLNIVGSGPEQAALIAQAEGDPSVVFHGALSHADTLKHLRQSDLLVCPSVWAEPFGLTIIEAMGAGIPVIASKLGGPAKIVAHGESGYLVEAEDVNALHQRIDELLSYPKRGYDMGRRSRSIYEVNYIPRAHAQHLVKCFQDILNKSQA